MTTASMMTRMMGKAIQVIMLTVSVTCHQVRESLCGSGPILGGQLHVFCLLCQEDVFYTGTHSTGMLERHVKRKHSELFKQALGTGAKKVPKIDVSKSVWKASLLRAPPLSNVY
jgi:hypothetical protein